MYITCRWIIISTTSTFSSTSSSSRSKVVTTNSSSSSITSLVSMCSFSWTPILTITTSSCSSSRSSVSWYVSIYCRSSSSICYYSSKTTISSSRTCTARPSFTNSYFHIFCCIYNRVAHTFNKSSSSTSSNRYSTKRASKRSSTSSNSQDINKSIFRSSSSQFYFSPILYNLSSFIATSILYYCTCSCNHNIENNIKCTIIIVQGKWYQLVSRTLLKKNIPIIYKITRGNIMKKTTLLSSFSIV